MIVSDAMPKAAFEPASRLKLSQAVREFESMLIADLLKMADAEKKEESPGGMEGYNDMRIQAVSTALAASGGVGIGKMLLSKLDSGKEKQY